MDTVAIRYITVVDPFVPSVRRSEVSIDSRVYILCFLHLYDSQGTNRWHCNKSSPLLLPHFTSSSLAINSTC